MAFRGTEENQVQCDARPKQQGPDHPPGNARHDAFLSKTRSSKSSAITAAPARQRLASDLAVPRLCRSGIRSRQTGLS